MAEEPPNLVKLSFERKTVTLPISALVALKSLRSGMKQSKKFAQIVASVRAIGVIEPPVVAPDPKNPGSYFLLDGLLRVEALKDLGATEVECLVSTDDEAFTYNKRINRLAAIQEHRMIVRTIERGVSEAQIAEALGLDIVTVKRRFRMLDGICPDVAELLKDSPCPAQVFEILRRMVPLRQIEAAELMVGQNNFTVIFAKALLLATPEDQLVDPRKRHPAKSAVSSEHIARLERELVNLQTQIKSVEDGYGIDNLHLTVAKGYVAKLLGNARVVRWLTQNRPEYLAEFQTIAEIQSLPEAVEADGMGTRTH